MRRGDDSVVIRGSFFPGPAPTNGRRYLREHRLVERAPICGGASSRLRSSSPGETIRERWGIFTEICGSAIHALQDCGALNVHLHPDEDSLREGREQVRVALRGRRRHTCASETILGRGLADGRSS